MSQTILESDTPLYDALPENYQMDKARWSKGRNVLLFIALVSVVACGVGYLQDPDRFFRSYAVAFTFTASIGLGALFFVMAQHLSGSAASVTVRRIQENIMITLPVCALLFIPVALGLKSIYSWTTPGMFKDTKGFYLTPSFFTLRTYCYFLLWSIWVFAIYRQSVKQDEDRAVRRMHIISRWSGPGLLLVVVVGTLAAYDWLMSVQPNWFSTIFGLYYLAGGALAFMSIVVLVALGFRRAGILREAITIEHYHDLGKWLFCLTAFYTYIAFAQYLLIWYANIPQETAFFRTREVGAWWWISLSLPFTRFIIPFFVLLCRPAKRSLTVIGLVAAWSIAVQFFDMYWVIMPIYYPQAPQFHWLDFATVAATLSICGLQFWYRFRKNKMVPVGNLRFEQSLEFENA